MAGLRLDRSDLPDPYKRRRHGGTELELEAILGAVQTELDLEKKQTFKSQVSDNEAADGSCGRGRGHGGGRGDAKGDAKVDPPK